MDIGFRTDKGKMRSNNEDACYVMPRDRVFVVADGVGGSNSGEIASRTAVTGIVDYVNNHPVQDLNTVEQIHEYFSACVKDINYKVLESSRRFEQNRGMATTVVIAFVHKNKLYVTNVGDSRAYVYRNGRIEQITEDHTYVNTLVKAGIISKEEAETHENKNMITRAVGADEKIESDFFIAPLQKGDVVLLCTDGLYGEVEKTELVSQLSEGKTMGDTCCDLVTLANRNGGNDNITIICLKITEEDIDE